ncbi:MAG: hypothetical protein RL600_610, partial [Actinomycetota bacterium]
MHEVNEDSIKLREEVFAYARKRLEYDPAPLDGPQSPSWLREKAGITISEQGLGGSQALEIFSEILAPAIVSASAIYGGSWMEGAGAVFAENEVLSWFAQEAGLPKSAGGVFVQGGTLGNLSALVAARNSASQRLVESGKELPSKWKFICSAEAHSSFKSAAAVMDVEIIKANVDETGHLTGASVSQALAAAGDGVFAIVATAGTTNFGIVDRIDEIAQVANE